MNLVKSKKALSAEIKNIDLSKDLKIDQINFCLLYTSDAADE